MFIIVFDVAPPLYCRALFYKKCLSDKVLLSLAVLQDLPSFKEVCAYGTYIMFICFYSYFKVILLPKLFLVL